MDMEHGALEGSLFFYKPGDLPLLYTWTWTLKFIQNSLEHPTLHDGAL